MLMRDLNSVQDLETMYEQREVFYFYCSLTPHMIIYDNDENDYKILNLSTYETRDAYTVTKGSYYPAYPPKDKYNSFLVEVSSWWNMPNY